MGLTISYNFAPSLPPESIQDAPAAARRIIDQAVGLAQAAFQRQGIPVQAQPLRDEPNEYLSYYFQQLYLEGPAAGCEPLTLGWKKPFGAPWNHWQFCKTEYAAEFPTAHAAICAVLQELEQAGLIGDIQDEAEFYGAGKTRADLIAAHGESQAVLGQVHDQIQALGHEYQYPLPGGGRPRQWSPQTGYTEPAPANPQ